MDDLRIVATAAQDGDVAALYASYPPPHTITATADTHATISPSGAVPVVDGYDRTFSIRAEFGYSLTAVLVDGVAQALPLDSYTFSNVTADHTIAVSSERTPTRHISGTVTGLPAGRTAQVTASVAAGAVTVSSALDGTYSIEVPDNDYYTVSASAFPLADPFLQYAFVYGADETGIDFALTDATLLWLKFDGDVLDSSGLGNDGSLLGAAVTPAHGRVGGGCLSTVDGNGGVLIANALTAGPVDSYTMSVWLRVTGSNPWHEIYASNPWVPTAVNNWLVQERAGQRQIMATVNFSGDALQNNHPETWALGDWHFITIVYDSVALTTKFYFDGMPDGSFIHTQTVQPNFTGGSTIGCWGDVNNRPFRGEIDDLRIAATVAQDGDVAALYASYPTMVPHTITATAGANATISPSGAVSVLDGYDQTFSISAPLGYNITAVLVDGVAQALPLDSYTFSNVTADHTIAVSSTMVGNYRISGTVTGIPAGRTALVSAAIPGTNFTVSTALDGKYSIEVPDSRTYTVSAWVFPLADPSLQSVPVSGANVTGIDFALTDSTLVWYKFDGDGLDSSGNAKDGALQGGAVYGSGRVGTGALDTTAANGAFSVPELGPEINTEYPSFTMSAWMKPTQLTGWQALYQAPGWELHDTHVVLE